MASYIHTINPQIASLIGESESILLNQLEYWISKCGRKIAGQEEKWIYNSLAEWHKQFSYWSMYKLRKTIKKVSREGSWDVPGRSRESPGNPRRLPGSPGRVPGSPLDPPTPSLGAIWAPFWMHFSIFFVNNQISF